MIRKQYFLVPKVVHDALRTGTRLPLVGKSSQECHSIHVINPATTDQIASVELISEDEVPMVIEHSHNVFKSGVWSRSPAHVRSATLSRLARALQRRVPELARLDSLQTGRPIREMNAQLGRLPEWLEYYAALLKTHQDFVAPTKGPLLNYVTRVPLGVVVQITPFNHPLFIAVKKIAPALATGNSVIVKPSEQAPLSVLEFAEMAEEVGLPPGVLTVLPGLGPSVGAALVSHPLVKKVDLTAGTSTGRAVGGLVGANLSAYTAELGGKTPLIIFDDADLESSINGAAFAAFIASGQTCVSATRILIQDDIYDSFLAGFLAKVESITRRIGNPQNPASMMGTVISKQQLERIEAALARCRRPVLAGGARMTGASPLDGFDLSQGAFLAPTVIGEVEITDELWIEELFGPVVVVKRFKTEREGVDLANACKYGLGAGVWTTNLSRAHRVAADIEAGLVWVNAHHRNDPSSPWGGMKDTGIGRENGIEAFEAYSQSKSIIVNISSPEESRKTDDWFSEGVENAKRYG